MYNNRKSLHQILTTYISLFCYLTTLFFSPVLAHAEPLVKNISQEQSWDNKNYNAPFAVKLYFVRHGDTLESLSRRFGLPVQGLVVLNSRYVNLTPESRLIAGTTLIVPAQPISEEIAASFSENYVPGRLNSETKAWLEAIGRDANRKGDLKDMVRQRFADSASGKISTWLNQYGTARINLNFDNHAAWLGGEAEALFPLYENNSRLFFTQLAFHNSDDRWQTNAGFGIRSFDVRSMLGFNGFFDYDISHKNARLGLGLELWLDYLRLSANSYLGLTSWHESPVYAKLLERPANGFDVRAQAFLPFFPQLGVSARYEQYFGKISTSRTGEGSIQLLQDPASYILGVQFTPVPLFTLNVDHKITDGVPAGTRVGLEATYRFGVPLADQLDTHAVGRLRTVMGGRYDLVERNKNIVLEYQYAHPTGDKKAETLGYLTFVPQDVTILSDSEEKVSVILEVRNSQGQLKDIDESTLSYKTTPEDLQAKVSEFTHIGKGKYALTVQSGKVAETFKISAIAEHYRPVSANVHIVDSVVPSDRSSLEVNPKKIHIKDDADETSKNTAEITFQAKDKQGQPIFGLKDKLAFVVRDETGKEVTKPLIDVTSIEAIQDGKKAVYKAKISGTKIGHYTIHVRYLDQELQKPSTTLTIENQASKIDEANSSFTLSPDKILADDQDQSSLIFKGVDQFGNAISDYDDHVIDFEVRDEQNTLVQAPEITIVPAKSAKIEGYKASLRGQRAGIFTVTPKIDGVLFKKCARKITLIPDNGHIDGQKSSFAIEPSVIDANDSSVAKFIVNVRDKFGNGVEVDPAFVKFIVKNAAGVVVEPPMVTIEKTQADSTQKGQYVALSHGQKAGPYTITPVIENRPYENLAKTLILKADNDPIDLGKSSFEITPNTISADDKKEASFNLDLKDKFGNGIAVKPSEVTFLIKNSQGSYVSAPSITVEPTKDGQMKGHYTAQVHGKIAEHYTVIPTVKGESYDQLKKELTLTAKDNAVDLEKSSFAIYPPVISADNDSQALLIFELKDKFGNGIAHNADDIQFVVTDKAGQVIGNPAVTVSKIKASKQEGQYIAEAHGEKGGSYLVTPKVGGRLYKELAKPLTLTTTTNRVDASKSRFEVKPTVIAADDKAISQFIFDAKDQFGNALDLSTNEVEFTVEDEDGTIVLDKEIHISITKKGDIEGRYVAEAHGKRAGHYHVTPWVSGVGYDSMVKDLTLSAKDNAVDEQKTQFTIALPKIYANDKDKDQLILDLSDAFGNPLERDPRQVRFIVKDQKGNVVGEPAVIIEPTQKTNNLGRYVALLRGQKAGTYSIIPQIANIKYDHLAKSVTLLSDDQYINRDKSRFEVKPALIPADDKTKSVLIFDIKDNFDNPATIDPKRVHFIVKDQNGAIVNAPAVTIDATKTNPDINGQYLAYAHGQKDGKYKIIPEIDGKVFDNLTRDLSLTANNNPITEDTSHFVIQPNTIVANDKSNAQFVLDLRDEFGNIREHDIADIHFIVTNSAKQIVNSPLVKVEATQKGPLAGRYVAMAHGQKADTYTVTPKIADVLYNKLAKSFILTADTENIDEENSQFSVTPTTIKANDQMLTEFRFEAKDKFGNAVHIPFDDVTFLVKDSYDHFVNAPIVTVGVTKNEAGSHIYTAQAHGQKAGAYTIIPQIKGKRFDNLGKGLTLTAGDGEIDEKNSQFVVSPAVIAADDNDIADLVLDLKDKFGNIAERDPQKISFVVKDEKGQIVTKPKITIEPTEQAGSEGLYLAQAHGQVSGKYVILPKIDNKLYEALAQSLTLTADHNDVNSDKSHFTVTPQRINADNQTKAKFVFELRDNFGNLINVESDTVSFIVQDSQGHAVTAPNVTVEATQKDASGAYIAFAYGQRADNYQIVPKVNDNAYEKLAQPLVITASHNMADSDHSHFTVEPYSIAANDQDKAELVFDVEDQYGNRLDIDSGQIKFLVKDEKGQTITAPVVTIDKTEKVKMLGRYVATAHGQRVGDYQIIPQIGNVTYDKLAKALTLTADRNPIDETVSYLDVEPQIINANNKDKAELILMLQDKFGNIINLPADRVKFVVLDSQNRETTAPFVTVTNSNKDNNDNSYHAQLYGQRAGSYQIIPTIDGKIYNKLAKTVKLIADNNPLNEGKTTFVVQPELISADDNTFADLMLDIKDEFGNGINIDPTQVKFQVRDASNQPVSTPIVTIEPTEKGQVSGTYKAKLHGRRAGAYTVIPVIETVAHEGLGRRVELSSKDEPIDKSQSQFTVMPNTIAADNNERTNLSLTLNDSFGNGIDIDIGRIKFLVKDSNGHFVNAPLVTVEAMQKGPTAGHYSARIYGQKAGQYLVIPQIDGSFYTELAKPLGLTAKGNPINDRQSKFDIRPATIAADDESKAEFIFDIHDQFGNPLEADINDIGFIVKNEAGQQVVPPVITVEKVTKSNIPGRYVALAHGQKAGRYHITPEVGMNSYPRLTKDLMLTAEHNEPAAKESEFEVKPQIIDANDSTKAELWLTVRDKFGNPLDMDPNLISFTLKNEGGYVVGMPFITVDDTAKTGQKGVYLARVRGRKAGNYKVIPQIGNQSYESLAQTLVLTAEHNPVNNQESKFAIQPQDIAANDSDTANLILDIRDQFGNVIAPAAEQVTFLVKNEAGGVTEKPFITVEPSQKGNIAGRYVAKLHGQRAGKYTVIPRINNNFYDPLAQQVNLSSKYNPLDVQKSTFTVDPNRIRADDKQTATLVFTAKDRFGNAVDFDLKQVTFLAKNSAGKTVISPDLTIEKIEKVNGQIGQYRGIIHGQKADNYTIIPVISSKAYGDLAKALTLDARDNPGNKENSTFSIQPKEILANDSTQAILNLEVKDNYGNPIDMDPGRISFIVRDDADQIIGGPWVTIEATKKGNRLGHYNAKLRGQKAGHYRVTPKVSNVDYNNLTQEITLIAKGNPVDENVSKFTLTPDVIDANNRMKATLSFAIRDRFNNKIPLDSSKINFIIKDDKGNLAEAPEITIEEVQKATNVSDYVATLRGYREGKYTVTPKISDTVYNKMARPITLTAERNPVSEERSKFYIYGDTNNRFANGKDPVTIILELFDEFGNRRYLPIGDINFKLTTVDGKPISGDVRFDKHDWKPGYYVNVYGNKAGDYKVTPIVRNQPLAKLAQIATLIPNNADVDQTKSVFTVTPSKIKADDQDKATLTLKAYDKWGNALTSLANHKFTFIVKDESGILVSNPAVTITQKTMQGNVYTAELKGQKAGRYTVTLQVDGESYTNQQKSVTLVSDDNAIEVTHSKFSLSPNQLAADDKSTANLTLDLKDQYDNPLTRDPAKIQFLVTDDKGTVVAAPKVTVEATQKSNITGQYVAKLHGQKAGTYSVTPKVDGTTYSQLAKVLTLTVKGAPVDTKQSSFTIDKPKIAANDEETALLTLTVADQFGNALDFDPTKVTFVVTDAIGNVFSKPKVTVEPTEKGKTTGVYVAKLHGQLAKDYKITPKIETTSYSTMAKDLKLDAEGNAVDLNRSNFYIAPKRVFADGKSKIWTILFPEDKFGNALMLSSDRINFKVIDERTGQEPAQKDLWYTKTSIFQEGPRAYETEISSIKPGFYDVYLILDGVLHKEKPLRAEFYIDNTIDEDYSQITIQPKKIVANDKDTATITVDLRNGQNQQITDLGDHKLSFKVTNSAGTTVNAPAVVITDQGGKAVIRKALIKGRVSDDYKVTLVVDGKEYGKVTAPITLTAGDISERNGDSTLTVHPNKISADGEQKARVDLHLRDEFGNPVTGLDTDEMYFVTRLSGTQINDIIYIEDFVEDTQQKGLYHADIVGQKSGNYTLNLVVGHREYLSIKGDLEITHQDLDFSKSSLEILPDTIYTAQDSAAIVVFTARDKNGRPIYELKPSDISYRMLNSGGHDVNRTFHQSKVVHTGDGIYEMTLKALGGTWQGVYRAVLYYKGKRAPIDPAHVKVERSGLFPDIFRSRWTVSNPVIEGKNKGEATITLVARTILDHAYTHLAPNGLRVRVLYDDGKGNSSYVQKPLVTYDQFQHSPPDSGHYVLHFRAQKPGTYTIEVSYAGLPLPVSTGYAKIKVT